ncbi:hypothetical protein [Methylobacterium sp. J-090]|uniref:hypothetical protein n=1 Tax=Methylobacterium sp. J-090 TaxID=2836666 RepID=UPI001FBB0F05|nr:hypothetical protein [Methylobacterium sp. J-090]MCJ2084219.1 hypothetical protein [Methylobacterium sp. J-090]
MAPHSAAQSRSLDYHWSVPDHLHDLPGLATLGKNPYRKARASVLASALIAHGTEQPVVSYSRRRDWYVNRFENTAFSHRTVVNAVDEAVSAGLLGHLKAKPGDHLTTGLQSVFWAEDALVDALGDVTLEYERGSPIRLRDAEGNPMAFRETERVARMRREMDGINAYMSQISVGISDEADPSDWDVGRHRIRARKVKDGRETWATVCPTPGNDVYRVYGRGRFDKGGRIYGWWQSLPKIRRSELLIDGEVTFEPDFEFIHPKLLYALRGAVLVGDPYVTGVFPRAHGKLALNVALNAWSLPLAINALLFRNIESPGAWPHTRSYTERLVNAVVARNAPIAADIGADRGIDLMNIDSGIAVRVLKACEKAGIEALPIHDSFRVRASHEGQVTAIMQQVLDVTLVAISPSRSKGSFKMVPHMRLPPSPEARDASLPKGSVVSSPPVVAPAAEPVVAPSPEGRGSTPSSLETLSPEVLCGPGAGVTAPFPEGEESLLSGGTGSPSSEPSFRPVLPVRLLSGPVLSGPSSTPRPFLRPLSRHPLPSTVPPCRPSSRSCSTRSERWPKPPPRPLPWPLPR